MTVLCWDETKWGLGLWERFSLFFFDVISHSSLLGGNEMRLGSLGTVRSFRFRCNSSQFSVEMKRHTRLTFGILSKWKIDQKSIKNRPKIDQKSTKIGLGAPPEPPGAVLEASKKRLGGKGRLNFAVITKVRRILVPKTEPKAMKNRPQKLYNFQYLLKSIFSWILVPK